LKNLEIEMVMVEGMWCFEDSLIIGIIVGSGVFVGKVDMMGPDKKW